MADPATTGEQVNAPAPATQGNGEGMMIPKGRFDEVNSARKEAEKLAAELLKEKQEREQAEAIRRGDFEKVLAEKEARLAALEPKAALADQIEAERREELLARLPESARPFAADLETSKLRAFVELNGGTQKPPTPPVADGKPGASGIGGKASPEEIRENGWKPGWLEQNKHRL